MRSFRKVALLTVVAGAVLGSAQSGVEARGGGGGRGGFGGGFGGFRGDAGGGFRDGDFGRIDPSYYGGGRDAGREGGPYSGDPAGFSRPDAFNSTPRVSDTELRSAANTSYNWGGGHAISTDGGFSRLNDAGFNRVATAGYGNVTNRVNAGDFAANARAVRDHYGYNNIFNRDWWYAHRGYWPYGWGDAWCWGGCGWGDLAGWWDMPVDQEPVDYDYGNNITYQGNQVYYGTTPEESTQQYYTDAQNLATSAPASVTSASDVQQKDWKPLGVYSMVQGSETNTTMMFQLAVNKQGYIKGTYYNALTQETKPVQGAVDKKRGRVAWTVGDDKNVVYEAGLSNLLKQQCSMLVHYGKDKTQQWSLVKLQQPQGQSTSGKS